MTQRALSCVLVLGCAKGGRYKIQPKGSVPLLTTAATQRVRLDGTRPLGRQSQASHSRKNLKPRIRRPDPKEEQGSLRLRKREKKVLRYLSPFRHTSHPTSALEAAGRWSPRPWSLGQLFVLGDSSCSRCSHAPLPRPAGALLSAPHPPLPGLTSFATTVSPRRLLVTPGLPIFLI